MRILFLIGAASRIRNFDHTIAHLADRGHTVTLTGRLRKGSFEVPAGLARDAVSGRVNPTERVDEWRDLVDLLRGCRDYVRYFDPRYAQATRLVRRAYEIAPTGFVLFCERHPWVKRHWRAASRTLAICEELIPSDPGFEAFIREQQPDLIVVTPLVTFESYQTDYVKVAHRLGIPVAFVPFSWDNLTNKGLMRVHPDRTLVWNEVQRQEAIDLHGCVPGSVVVTGAARFDDFFDRHVSVSREELFAAYGLDPARPMVLYLGSSQLTGPNEMELVRRWLESLRSAEDPVVRGCAVLIRPHPALADSWAALDFSALGQVAMSSQSSRSADQELFDCLHHAHLAVGLNTSAMLEAAVVGRPVHTLVVPGFDEGQVGTIHFRYLVEAFGGLATIASDFDEHRRQLSTVLRGDPVTSARSLAFAEQFLRPHGAGRPVSEILATEIERAGAIAKRPRPRTPLWHVPARAVVRAVLHSPRAAGATTDTTIVGTSMSLRPVRTALEEIQQGTVPVFVGPWNDSAAHELLYWIPFVRWAAATYGLPPERLIVLSRGGVAEWYGPLARRYLDAPKLFSRQELDYWLERTVPQSQQNPKQSVSSPFDEEIVRRAARALDLVDYQVLHPMAIFRILMRLHKHREWEPAREILSYRSFDATQGRPIGGLPASFVAVSTSFTSWLPDSPKNREFLTRMVTAAAAAHPVIVVDAPRPTHADPAWPVRWLDEFATDRVGLPLQSAVISRARAFIGPYGDFAVLSAFAGTAAIAYHTKRLPEDQIARAQNAAVSAGWGPITIERAARFKRIKLPKARRTRPAMLAR